MHRRPTGLSDYLPVFLLLPLLSFHCRCFFGTFFPLFLFGFILFLVIYDLLSSSSFLSPLFPRNSFCVCFPFGRPYFIICLVQADYSYRLTHIIFSASFFLSRFGCCCYSIQQLHLTCQSASSSSSSPSSSSPPLSSSQFNISFFFFFSPLFFPSLPH